MTNLTLKSLLEEQATSLYYDPGFMTFIDDHLPTLRRSTSTRVVEVEPSQALKYRGDLFGLLDELGIPPYAKYTIMKMNDYKSPTEIKEALLNTLMIPDVMELRKLFNLWRAHNATRK